MRPVALRTGRRQLIDHLCVTRNDLCVKRTTTVPRDLLPIFRSDGQARILGEIYLHPERETSMSDLARRAGLHPASVQREVSRLEDAGILQTGRVGTARMVRADVDSPIHHELSLLVLKVLGPPVVISRAIAGVTGIDQAFIFGSWAQRMLGQPGASPADIDLLVVGEPDRSELTAACRQAAAALGREVQPVVVSPGDWDPPKTGFLRSVREQGLVPVQLGEA